MWRACREKDGGEEGRTKSRGPFLPSLSLLLCLVTRSRTEGREGGGGGLLLCPPLSQSLPPQMTSVRIIMPALVHLFSTTSGEDRR